MENAITKAPRFETPYHEAWDYISHYDCGTSYRIAKLVLSMFNENNYPFPVGECLKNLDSIRKALALDLIAHYARHGKTEALNSVGNDILKQFPSFVSLGKAACQAREQAPEPGKNTRVLEVSVGDCDLPAFGAYLAPSARDGRAQILLNFPLIYAVAKSTGESPAKLISINLFHEVCHALQDVCGLPFSESDIEALTAAAEGIQLQEHPHASESQANILQWRHYDGTMETLPDPEQIVLVLRCEAHDETSWSALLCAITCPHDQPTWKSGSFLQQATIGDIWIPAPPDWMLASKSHVEFV